MEGHRYHHPAPAGASSRVLKFGGTSVRDAGCLARAATIVAACQDTAVVVVVSAAAGVTRRLLQLGSAAAAGPSPAVTRELAALEALHRDTLVGLALAPAAAEPAGAALSGLFADLRTALQEIARSGACRRRDHDQVMSFGERLSSTLIAAALSRHDRPVRRVAAGDVMITDDCFRQARPDAAEIEVRARRIIAPLIAGGAVVVTEGFIGATRSGLPTTMGFEASDLSAALLGAALGAAEIQIWTDVPGMLTSGHPAVAAPRLVPCLSYDEAAELALFGAKVLHPDTVAPARARGIPVRILHAADPRGSGTWIGDEMPGAESPAADRSRGAGPATHDAGGGGAAPSGAARVKAIAVTENPDDESFAGVRRTLRRQHPGGWAGRAVVCPVGAGIGSSAAVIAALDAALQGISGAVPLARRPHALPVDVPRERIAEVVARLHAVLVVL